MLVSHGGPFTNLCSFNAVLLGRWYCSMSAANVSPGAHVRLRVTPVDTAGNVGKPAEFDIVMPEEPPVGPGSP